MKRFVLFFAAMLCGVYVWAETVSPTEMGIRYYMPKTKVTLTVEYTETTFVPGKYAEWAEELLGVDNAIMEDSVAYTIGETYLTTETVADTSRCYIVHPEAGLKMQWLSLTREGLLYGYNMPYAGGNERKRKQKDEKETTTTSIQPVSLLEETIKCDSLPCQARSVAKQIYQLRDNRIYLLSGDAENQPADGVSMKAILKEIDHQEQALVELFMGTEVKRKKHVDIAIDPAADMDSVVFCIGDDSIRVYVEPFGHQEAPVAETGKKSKPKKGTPVPSQIYFNQPGSTQIVVSSLYDTLLDEIIPVAQLGVSVPLSTDLFTENGGRMKIRFDIKTGNILSIYRPE